MRILEFDNNVHNMEKLDIPDSEPRAINLTVRKGLKWSNLEIGDVVEIREAGAEPPLAGQEVTAEIYDIKVMVFKDFNNYDKMLHLHHDPALRNFRSIHTEMRNWYDGFVMHDIVTLVYYEIIV